MIEYMIVDDFINDRKQVHILAVPEENKENYKVKDLKDIGMCPYCNSKDIYITDLSLPDNFLEMEEISRQYFLNLATQSVVLCNECHQTVTLKGYNELLESAENEDMDY